MKRLNPLTLTASVVLLMGVSGYELGKYPSKQQAMDACYEWIDEGKFAEYEGDMEYTPGTRKTFARECVDEKETNQILGKENDLIVNGEYDYSKGITGTYKLKKNFRY